MIFSVFPWTADLDGANGDVMDFLSSNLDGVPMTDPIIALPSLSLEQAHAIEPNPAVPAAPSDQTPPGQTLLFSAAELQAAVPASAATPGSKPAAKPAPRINRPERFQGEYRSESLDQRLDADHPARLVWAYVEGLDLAELFDQIEAVESSPAAMPPISASSSPCSSGLTLTASPVPAKSTGSPKRTAPTNGSAAAFPQSSHAFRLPRPAPRTARSAAVGVAGRSDEEGLVDLKPPPRTA